MLFKIARERGLLRPGGSSFQATTKILLVPAAGVLFGILGPEILPAWGVPPMFVSSLLKTVTLVLICFLWPPLMEWLLTGDSRLIFPLAGNSHVQI